MEKRQSWSSRGTFIMAAIGSAVGLGNAWRFPGLAAKYGGGAFLLVYILAMLILGFPLLMMEISVGRKTRQGAPGAMRTLNPKCEFVGWTATCNAFAITTYYAVVFAWVILMVFSSYQFIGFTGTPTASKDARGLFFQLTQTTGTISGFHIPLVVAICLLVAWVSIYLCIRKGTVSVGKVVKYTGLMLPLIFLVIMAVKGLTMNGAMVGMAKLFTPDFSAVIAAHMLPSLIIDAIGQVFFSLSIMMAIMFAYGSYLDDNSCVAVDAAIIAIADLGISVLSGIVMFTTMYGVGMSVADMSSSGIATAFKIYPQAIVNLTSNGVVNALFGAVFYLCLCSLAIDSAFSIVEGIVAAIADKFGLTHRKTAIGVCLVAGIISLVYTTQAGLAWLDIVDRWTNQYTMIIVGVMECLVVGWFFDPGKVLAEVNRNATRFRMPKWWFITSIKVIAPLALVGFCGWNLYALFDAGGIYGVEQGYPLWSNLIAGWGVMLLAFLSGPIINAIYRSKKKNGLVVEERTWDEC